MYKRYLQPGSGEPIPSSTWYTLADPVERTVREYSDKGVCFWYVRVPCYLNCNIYNV